MIVVRARPEEVDELTSIAFAAKAHWGYPESWMKEWTDALTITAPYIAEHPTYTALIDERIVGFYTVQIGADPAVLDHFWIAPPAMRRGIGRSLFAHAVSVALSAQRQWLRIISDPHAEAFYHKMGAQTVGHLQTTVGREYRFLPVLEKWLQPHLI